MSEPRAHLRVVRGDPSPEDLAAITALLTAAATGGDTEPEPLPRGRWNDPVWRQRTTLRPGPGAWRASLR